MKKLKLACFATLLIGGVAVASPSCDRFQVKLHNLADDLVITGVKLDGAEITPGTFGTLAHGAEQIFVVNNSNADIPMIGEFTLHTISLPTQEIKKLKIRYKLENKAVKCEHEDLQIEGDYKASKSREVGAVKYTINY